MSEDANGAKAPAIESAADGLDDILRAQPLSDLSKIHLVGYGRDGEVNKPQHEVD